MFFLARIFPYLVRILENTDQKKLRIWTLFTQCNIYLNVVFCPPEMTEKITFHVCDPDLSSLLHILEHEVSLAVKWFECSYLKILFLLVISLRLDKSQ